MLQCLVTKDNRTVTNLRPEGPSPSTIKHLETMRGVQGCAEREAPRKSCDLYQVTQGKNGSQEVQWQRIHPPIQEMQETPIPSLGQEDPPSRNWQPTPLFSPGKLHGKSSLVVG